MVDLGAGQLNKTKALIQAFCGRISKGHQQMEARVAEGLQSAGALAQQVVGEATPLMFGVHKKVAKKRQVGRPDLVGAHKGGCDGGVRGAQHARSLPDDRPISAGEHRPDLRFGLRRAFPFVIDRARVGT